MNRALKLTQDGRIDLDGLNEWPVHDLREWLLARLHGSDPSWPVDHDNFETPEALFVRLWRDADSNSPFVERLGRSCAELLRLAWESEPADWMAPLFDLVATIRPEACRQFLNAIVLHHEFSEGLRARKLDRAWLRTLAAYDPQTPELIGVWLGLLQDDRYVDIAYRALGHSIDLAAWFLPEYYARLTEAEREVLIPEAVRSMLDRGWDIARRSLERYAARFARTPGLCQAVDAALGEMHVPPFFAANPAPEPPQAPGADTAHENGAGVLPNVANEPAEPEKRQAA